MDFYQYHPSSYPGHTVYRDLTAEEVEVELPKAFERYRNFFRAARHGGIEAAFEHISGSFSHRPLTVLLESMRSELVGKKMCNTCRKICPSNTPRRCDSCPGIVSVISDEIISEQFLALVKSRGQDIEVRYYPGTGFRAKDNPDHGQRVIPGDLDLLPPT